jgi:hypothetical protein
MNKTLLVLTAVVASSAFAQDAATNPPPPPPPAPIEAAPPADAPMTDPGGRVRWGVGANIGWHIPSMFTIGAEGRVGYVFSNLFNAYLIGGGVAGFGFGGSANSTGGSVSVSAVSYWFLGAIAEVMFGNIFYVGAGPVVAGGGFATVGLSASTEAGAISTVTHSGVAPGFDVRLGLGFGSQKGPPSFRRGGFNLGISVMTLFRPNSVVARLEGSSGGGSATVTTNELFVTAAPMLTLGYDAR